MKKLALTVFALVLVALCFVGCKDKSCDTFKPATNAAGAALAQAIGCSGVSAIQEDLFAAMQNSGQCKAMLVSGTIATLICPLAVNLVMAYGTQALPADWLCTGTPVASVLSLACNAIPF